jgi:hypothetical protein
MPDQQLEEIELFGWLGEDEMGSGEIGLKQGLCAAGCVPLVAVKQHKMSKFIEQMQQQVNTYGKPISFCRYKLVEVIDTLHPVQNGEKQ